MNREALEDVNPDYPGYPNGESYVDEGFNPEAPAGGPIVIDYGHGHVPKSVDTEYNQGPQEGMEVDGAGGKEEEEEGQ